MPEPEKRKAVESNDRLDESLIPLVAGFAGGAVSTTLLFPLDLVKTRLQVIEMNSTKARRRFRALRILGGILKYEGVRGLYSGWTPAVVGSAVSWGGYFFFYERFKRQLTNYKASTLNTHEQDPSLVLTPIDYFSLACFSGAIMVGICNPIFLVKLRIQLQMRKSSMKHNIKVYDGMLDALRKIPREEGILALYKGSVPAFLLTSHGGVQFAVYEYLRKQFHYTRATREESNSVWERLELSSGYLAIGAVAKMTASVICYPLQVVKARLQQASHSLELTVDGEVRSVRREYSGFVSTVVKMWRTEGPRSFFNGIIPNAVRVAPSAAITFVVYEGAVDFLGA